MVIFGVLYFCE